MDIQHLVDRLEDLIDEGRHFPFSKFTFIDEERALEIIDQMRISVPEQIEKASRLINQRDRLLAQAREESERIIQVARQESETMTTRDSIVQAAQNRAANVIAQAKREAQAIRDEADVYVMDVLSELQSQLERNLSVARNGIAKIEEERQANRARLQTAYDQAAAEVAAQARQFAQQREQATVQEAEEVSVDVATEAHLPGDSADD